MQVRGKGGDVVSIWFVRFNWHVVCPLEADVVQAGELWTTANRSIHSPLGADDESSGSDFASDGGETEVVGGSGNHWGD